MKLWGQPAKGRSREPSQPSQKERPTTNARDTCDSSTHTVDEKDSKKSTEPSPDQSIQQVLGMTIEQALAIWDKQGRPIIHLGPGENCHDLAKLLGQRDIKPQHLSAIKEWLEKHQEGPADEPSAAETAGTPTPAPQPTPNAGQEWEYYLKDGRGPFPTVQEAMDALGLDKDKRPKHQRWDRLSTQLKEQIQRRPKVGNGEKSHRRSPKL